MSTHPSLNGEEDMPLLDEEFRDSVVREVRRCAEAVIDVHTSIGRLTAEVSTVRSEVSHLRAEVGELRGEVHGLEREADNSGQYNLRAIELAAEAKAKADKKTPSIPPLVIYLAKLPGKVVEHWAAHIFSLLVGAALLWLSHWLRFWGP